MRPSTKIVAKYYGLYRHHGVIARKLSNHNFETTPIVPMMWTGTPAIEPELFTIDVTHEKMMDGPNGNPSLARKMQKKFDDVGLVLLRGQESLGDHLDVMREWARVCIPNLAKYEGGANSRLGKIENVYEVGAPSDAWLHYHHEMAYVKESVKALGFCATDVLEPTPEDPLRGASFVSCNMGATKDVLDTEFGQKLKEKGICYVRCLTDQDQYSTMHGIYNHWQRSFMTDDPKEAEKRAAKKGLKTEWGEGRYMKTKFYVSGFEYAPMVDKNVLYSSIADHGSWFDTWPGVAEKPYIKDVESASPKERPLAITFGDDSEMSLEDLKTFARVYDNHGIPLQWKKGDIGVVCNYRFAHGRHKYVMNEGEKRELGVILGEMYPRLGTLPGKW